VKTRFFSTFGQDEGRSEFLNDFIVLLNLDEKQTDQFVDLMPELLAQDLDQQEPAARLADRIGVAIYQAESLLRWTKHVFRYRQRNQYLEDTPTAFSEDLSTLVSEDEKSGLQKIDNVHKLAARLSTRIFEIAEEMRPQYFTRLFARGILPKFQHMSSTVELRGVIDNGFFDPEKQTDLDVSDYQPRIIDLVEVASVHLETDTGDHYYFQMTEADIGSVIRSLTATLRELRALRASVSFGNREK
jgi:hypothetical protein